jgi:hypothetical protein
MTVHIGWVVIILIAVAAWYVMKHKPMTTQ